MHIGKYVGAEEPQGAVCSVLAVAPPSACTHASATQGWSIAVGQDISIESISRIDRLPAKQALEMKISAAQQIVCRGLNVQKQGHS